MQRMPFANQACLNAMRCKLFQRGPSIPLKLLIVSIRGLKTHLASLGIPIVNSSDDDDPIGLPSFEIRDPDGIPIFFNQIALWDKKENGMSHSSSNKLSTFEACLPTKTNFSSPSNFSRQSSLLAQLHDIYLSRFWCILMEWLFICDFKFTTTFDHYPMNTPLFSCEKLSVRFQNCCCVFLPAFLSLQKVCPGTLS